MRRGCFDFGARCPDDVRRRHRRRDDAQRTLHEHHEIACRCRRGASTSPGRVDQKERTSIHLAWTEKNGPAVHPPEKRSFGTRLIETLGKQLKGDVRLTYKSTGFGYAFDVPIASY